MILCAHGCRTAGYEVRVVGKRFELPMISNLYGKFVLPSTGLSEYCDSWNPSLKFLLLSQFYIIVPNAYIMRSMYLQSET